MKNIKIRELTKLVFNERNECCYSGEYDSTINNKCIILRYQKCSNHKKKEKDNE